MTQGLTVTQGPAVYAALVLLVLLAGGMATRTPRVPVPAGRGSGRARWAGDFSPAEQARGARFRGAVRWPGYLGLLAGLVVAALLGLTSAGSALTERIAQPFGSGWGWRLVAGVLALSVVSRLVGLPFAVWSETLQRRNGLSTQTWRSWCWDQSKGLLLGWGLLLLLLPPAFAFVHRFPQHWWIGVAAAAAVLVFVLSFAFPLVVEPIFNRFEPLADGPLRTDLLALARRDGLPVREVLVADASRRTTALNAYVSGLGSTRRIVVYDTLLHRATPAEVRLVVAHELGHAKARDVLQGTVFGALAAALGAVVLFLVLTSDTLLDRAGADGAGDPRCLALAMLTLSVIGTVSGPVFNGMSRRIEARADVHSLELTGDPQTFAESERRLALTNLSDVDPPRLVQTLFGSHPTAPERIAVARRWAEQEGLPVPAPLLGSNQAEYVVDAGATRGTDDGAGVDEPVRSAGHT